MLGMHYHGNVATRPMTIMRSRLCADWPSWHFPFTDGDLQLTAYITLRASSSVLRCRLFAGIVWLPASQNCSHTHVPSNCWMSAHWTLDSQRTHAEKEIDSENATREHQETLQLNRIIQPFFHMNVQRLPGNALWFDNVFGPTATTNVQSTRDVCGTFLLWRVMMAVRCGLFSSALDPQVFHCSALVVTSYAETKTVCRIWSARHRNSRKTSRGWCLRTYHAFEDRKTFVKITVSWSGTCPSIRATVENDRRVSYDAPATTTIILEVCHGEVPSSDPSTRSGSEVLTNLHAIMRPWRWTTHLYLPDHPVLASALVANASNTALWRFSVSHCQISNLTSWPVFKCDPSCAPVMT